MPMVREVASARHDPRYEPRFGHRKERFGVDRGRVLRQSGNLSGAERLYLQLMRAAPQDATAPHLLGVVRAQQGRNSEALALMKAALKLRPEAPEVLSNLGNVLSAQGKFAEALASYDKALKVKPDYVACLSKRALALRDLRLQERLLRMVALETHVDTADATFTANRERMQQLGLNFVLNDETCAAFYRNLVRDNAGNGYAVLSALTVGEEVVATLLGIRQGARYVMVRISNAGEKWSNCSPGRLIIERTMDALHSDGIRQFDFSIGNYAYKRRFGVKRIALVDFTAALSWRGLPYALRDRAARWLRRHPALADRVKRALGKPASREEK